MVKIPFDNPRWKQNEGGTFGHAASEVLGLGGPDLFCM